MLLGLQHLYSDEETRSRLFALLEEHMLPGVDRTVGRPGMELWRILVMGVVMQGSGCDFDRLHELVNEHNTLRQFLGHADIWDKRKYEYQTVVDNVCLVRPELLAEVGQLIVESGHAVARKKPGEPLRGRCDSFVVETDVHYPTDVNLLWDAIRCLVRETGRAASEHGVVGWRQWRHLTKSVKMLFNRVRSTRRARPEHVEAYLECCRDLVERVQATLPELALRSATPWKLMNIEYYLGHAMRQIDHVERRLLKGETIPQDEKVFSIFESHTRWISKGKAGTPVELGVPVCVLEDNHGFILHHEVMWQGSDVDYAQPMIRETQARFPELRWCSFDRGFHSPENRLVLDELLDHNVLPEKDICRRLAGPANRIRCLSPCAVSIRRSNRLSTIWSIGVSTGSVPSAPMALPAWWRFPSSPSTSTASACCCAERRDDDAPPDGALRIIRHSWPAERREWGPLSGYRQ